MVHYCSCGNIKSRRERISCRKCFLERLPGLLRGKKLSPEHIEKLKKAKIGYIPWNKGLSPSEETKNKIRKTLTGFKHSPESIARMKLAKSLKHPSNYIEDRTKLKRFGNDVKDRRSYAYADWRKQVWLRDGFKCKIANPDCSGRIEAHHILGWFEYPELRYQINNGITLCHAHHPRKRAEEKRLVPTFQELVSVSK